MPKMHK